MPMRPINVARDTQVLCDVMPVAFQYPEHPEWGMQPDDIAEVQALMATVRRMRLVVAPMMEFVPSLRDAITGFVWEEAGEPIGLAMTGRQGSGGTWWIANVGVVPAFRRRRIARQLVEACIARARQRGAQRMVLDVISANTPAYDLYRSLGFERFTSRHNLEWTPPSIDPLTLPGRSSYVFSSLSAFDWRTRYSLARRITPPQVKRLQPVEPAAYRTPLAAVVFQSSITRISGGRMMQGAVRTHGSAEPIGTWQCSARRRGAGLHSLSLLLDSAAAPAARELVERTIYTLERIGPGRRIQMQVDEWQHPVLDAALAAGFRRVSQVEALGLIL